MIGDSQDAGRNPLTEHWTTFAGWHRETSLWREVYVRTLSALIAATVIYAVAAVSGLVSKKPLAVVGVGLVVLTTPYLLWQGVDMLVHRKDLRLTVDWSHTPPRNDAERRMRWVYRLTLGPAFVWIAGVVLIVLGIAGK